MVHNSARFYRKKVAVFPILRAATFLFKNGGGQA